MLTKFWANWRQRSFYDQLLITASVFFLLIVIVFLIIRGQFLTPDQFFGLGFIIALALGQGQAFLWDWTPLVLLILSYEYLRGLIPLVNKHIHFALMPDFDRLIFFGHVPSTMLQQWFFNPNHIHWYDYVAVIFYATHFVVPMLVGFGFWLSDRHYFREYAIGILGLSYVTFLTYLAFPAAPPWMGSQFGVIPPTQELTGIIITHLFPYVSLPTIYRYFGANLTAAVPSLHAAYPMLTALFVYKKLPKLWPLLVVYVLGLWVSVIYLGEHYFFDVVLGITYALVIYAVIQRIKPYLQPVQKTMDQLEKVPASATEPNAPAL